MDEVAWPTFAWSLAAFAVGELDVFCALHGGLLSRGVTRVPVGHMQQLATEEAEPRLAVDV